ncbi:hypothetical protein CVT26_002109 [Gymnopilus dilepis]|uniref:Eukaryotic translation initiation factor 3 subunit H n=1 Tax=Gymnopilus dilepis TaxID=231916 RepID=A0A409VBN4_9AGAR|nr:hypothetical protein CVT26_002109 [Gymnopilus dilepis]
MAATSMAAALAATLPAPSAVAPAPQPTYEAIPPSMAKVIDIEAEIPLTCVQLDGLVVSKIIKHAREAPSSIAHGLLLGLDLDGILEVSNSFALPHHAGEEDEKSAKATARHQASMLRALKEVQADDSVIGFYQAMTLGAFYNQTLVDTQAIHQEKLRHGGIVIVHDLSQAARGNASFRAYRLTAAFLDAYKKSNFSTASLMSHRLTFSSILEEVPLKIRTNPLLSAFLGTLTQPSAGRGVGEERKDGSSLGPSFSVLDLGTGGVTRNLEQIVEAVDNYRTEENNLSYLSRQIAREKAKAENYIAKRKEENQARVAQGLAPLPEEDVSRLFKIPPEPSRLESLLLLGQLDGYGKSLESVASTGLMSFTKCLVLFLSFVASAQALATPHAVRSPHHHRAIAARVAAPAPIDIPAAPLRRRQNTKKCRQRPSSSVQGPPSATPSSSSVPVVVKPTSTTHAAPPPSPTPPKETPTTPPPAPSPTTHAKPAPSPTTAPAKAPSSGNTSGSSSNLPSFLVGTQTGDGTFYSTGLGACGITNKDTDYIAAVSHLLFDTFPGAGVNPNLNPVCNKRIKATYQGKSVTITVTDRCTGCAITDLDFSPSAFDQLADESVGRLHGMTWDWL